MLGEIVDFGPLASGLLAPYQDAAVEAGGGEEGAEEGGYEMGSSDVVEVLMVAGTQCKSK